MMSLQAPRTCKRPNWGSYRCNSTPYPSPQMLCTALWAAVRTPHTSYNSNGQHPECSDVPSKLIGIYMLARPLSEFPTGC